LLQALPRKSEHQSVKLILAQRQGARIGCDIAGPLKATLVQSPCGAPEPKAIVHQEPDARRSGVGKQLTMMGLGGAEHLHHFGQQPVGAGAHVNGLDCQPQ